MPRANDIRQQFIDFFVKKHGHTFVPSSSVVPLDDPTLMFTNAGMNQFKDVFLGTGTRPYRRAVNSQKCIRASGKHNDLEDVGRDTYHHTFFEMLGNWSFGDYYKAEAVRWAWELLTKEWGIDKTRLHATVFGGDQEYGLEPDDEAFKLWTQETDINPKHVHRFGKKDNFWMMGETGPCGPCSEIHIDRTPDKSGSKLVNAGDARVMEIWNLVFIQYNRDEGGQLALLPAKHVDTGMGFERITAVLQNKNSNYDTDVFQPIMDAIAALVGRKYTYKLDDLNDIAFRVIADHLRMLTFSITDGALPDNKGRGSVIRSVLRRAVRFGWQCFNQREPFIYKLVPALVEHMGGAYPELKSNPGRVANVIKGEEVDFLKTIDKGLVEFEYAGFNSIFRQIAQEKSYQPVRVITSYFGPSEGRVNREARSSDELDAKLWYRNESGEDIYIDIEDNSLRSYREVIAKHCKATPTISGEEVFNLYTTFGFPPDLTRQMAQERGLLIDEQGFAERMKEHEEKSRGQTATGQTALNVSGGLPETDDRPKWFGRDGEGKILGWIADNEFHTKGRVGTDSGKVALILDKSCFYAEAGGQVGDAGTIRGKHGTFTVEQAVKVGNSVAHVGVMDSGHLEIGETVKLHVSEEREFTRKNHTATHLLHWALQKVLGEHVEQRGSKVKPDAFTFDFSHTGPLTWRGTDSEMDRVEQLVNERIYEDLQVNCRELPIEEARKLPGVRAFFGDKYGDVVRVVEIGDGFSREFCGGTHVAHTGQIGFFTIEKDEAVGKGVRRLTCKTAGEAVRSVQKSVGVVMDLADRFHCKWEDLPDRVKALQDENKKLKRGGAATDLQGVADRLLADAAEVNGARVIVGEMPGGPEEQVRQQADRLRQKAPSAVVVLGWQEDGKVQLLAALTDDLVKKGLHAGKLVGQVAKVVGGGGGGKPTMAQAGGKDPAKLPEALELARKLAAEQLAK
jgi:alanyl-tRNA synthetase